VVDIARAPQKKTRRYIYLGAGIAAVLVTTVALARLKPAAPTVDGGTLWRDTVRLGTMVRQVRGPGTLVPEQIRWISALTPGRVDRVLLLPGVTVTPSTVLLEISNPDVQLTLLDSQRQLTQAQADYVNLKTQLETQRLNQSATVSTARADYNEAKRQYNTGISLAKQNLLAGNELDRLKERAEDLQNRYEIETQRLKVISDAVEGQLSVQRSQIVRLESIVQFRQRMIESMHITAGAHGVLQELPLQVGQWVTPGVTLAKVVEPGRLKAVLRIPETQAKDILIGQQASIDTRNGIITGRVVRIDPAALNGTVGVDVALEGALPKGARPDLSVDGTIELERLNNVLYMGRPAYGQAESTVGIFKLLPGGNEAVRVNAKLGRSSVNTIEVLGGLNEGDAVILSDMSAYDAVERVALK
jgi:HlyD family secretion protein